jgi:hypothetical protein
VTSSVVEAMTLSVYDGTALQLDPNSHRLDASFPFGALSRSRLCPECIRESDGRWQLAWRLGWSFLCVVHNCVLADVPIGDERISTTPLRRSVETVPSRKKLGSPAKPQDPLCITRKVQNQIPHDPTSTAGDRPRSPSLGSAGYGRGADLTPAATGTRRR